MIPTAAGPEFQTTRPEFDAHVSFQSEKLGRSSAKEDQICGHLLDETTSEFQKWDMAVPSTNHEDRLILGKFDESQLNCTQHRALTDSSSTNIESNDAFDGFESFESLESPRADEEERNRAWLEQRKYRAWLGERRLHMH